MESKTREMNSETVSKDMTIGEVVGKWPHLAEIMTSYGLHCVGCHANPYESIEQGALGHGMETETFNQMMKDLKKAAAQGTANEQEHRHFSEVNFDEAKINLTDAAAKKVLEIMKEENKQGHGLRFGVMAGGCSGFKYVLDFEEKEAPNDLVLKEKGVKIFVDKEAVAMINGARIDFTSGLQGTGFKIENPNTEKSCGCGSSFS